MIRVHRKDDSNSKIAVSSPNLVGLSIVWYGTGYCSETLGQGQAIVLT